MLTLGRPVEYSIQVHPVNKIIPGKEYMQKYPSLFCPQGQIRGGHLHCLGEIGEYGGGYGGGQANKGYT